MNKIIDPFKFKKMCWPDITFYDKQIEIIESFRDNVETVVVAGNKLGKDFVAGFLSLWFFCSRRPSRVVTTSVNGDQLEDILWGEIRRLIQQSHIDLPIEFNHMKIRQKNNRGLIIPNAELVGRVCRQSEGLLGRHSTAGFKAVQNDIPRTAVFFDEASGIDNDTYKSTLTWSKRRLIIGNPFECENFFKDAAYGGDIPRTRGKGFLRKVIHIGAEDSPNIQLARKEIEAGLKPSNKIIIPGVKNFEELEENLATWDEQLISIGIHGKFYEGDEVKLYPMAMLDRANALHDKLVKVPLSKRTTKRSMGIDPAEGGDSTVYTIIDSQGMIKQIEKKTPDTSVIASEAIALGRVYNVPSTLWVFDRGGGGTQHADYLRKMGYHPVTVGFGESVSDTNKFKKGIKTTKQKEEIEETRYVAKNRRAQMYAMLRFDFLDEHFNPTGFAMPRNKDLMAQLSPLPLLRDQEGRLYLPPKDKPHPTYKGITIKKLLKRSPDHSDSLVLAIFGLTMKSQTRTAG